MNETNASRIKLKLTELKSQMMNELNLSGEEVGKILETTIQADINVPIKKKTIDGELPEKHFQNRPSLMTTLSENKNILVFRNIFLAVVFLQFDTYLLEDVVYKKSTYTDYSLLFWNFEGLWRALVLTWVPMMGASLFIVYYGFNLWVKCRKQSPALANLFFLLAFLAYIVLFFILPVYQIVQVSFSCRIFAAMEQMRMLLKSYAFVRVNAAKVLSGKEKVEDQSEEKKKDQVQIPTFGHYVYFMFAPTLIYRDEYPRSSKINWSRVGRYLFEIICNVILVFVVLQRCVAPFYKSINIKEIDFVFFVYAVHLMAIPNAMFFLCAFHGIFHCWMNLWAEILRFGDRQFYVDWWNAISGSEFLRKWNLLVQNWIYTYLYRDLKKIIRLNSLTMILTLVMSALIHDYLSSLFMGFYVPFFIISDTILAFTMLIPRFKKNNLLNIFFFYGLALGNSFMVFCISVEWYARHSSQCPRKIDDSFGDYFTSRAWQCWR